MFKDQDSDSLLYSDCHNFIAVIKVVFCFVFLVSVFSSSPRGYMHLNLAHRSCPVAIHVTQRVACSNMIRAER